MVEARVAGLERRVQALEAERRRWRRSSLASWLVAAVAVAVGAAAYVAKADDGSAGASIEAREFMIKDSATGELLFYVGPEDDGAVLFLKDRQGRITARLPFKREIVPVR
jgi:streptogramin lyase